MLIVDREKYIVNKNGIIVELSRIEFEIIYLLAKVPGKVYSRTSIFKQIWPDETRIKERTVDVHIVNIRKKLGADIIKTIKGVGYKMAIEPIKIIEKTD
ncbi:MAG: DNA-binding response regulator [Bacteroidetes bacterium]|jgi:two-component system alkaline phosphatase synthesis response regulator PhoP|nr:MAG: DNA-binding response regulator [Bacteroidota bacterium]